jgi:catechol 2,3-dioxygenase-like lactoylglutathione lyase family enzyme
MENPSIMSHVSLGTNDFTRAKAFYTAVLATIGAGIVMEHPDAVAFGKQYPEFWVQAPIDGKPANTANGVHFGFWANSKDEVHAFHAAALRCGATEHGAPGPREEYGAPYYGCFARDLDGHKIEAAFWDEELAQKLGMGT